MPYGNCLLIAAMLIAYGAEGWAQRTVDENTLTSTKSPAVRLELDEGFEYLGDQEFNLYGVARVEQHFFAELDGERLQRLYWIQFEHVLESSDHTYDYSDLPDVVSLGGHPFRTDRRVWDFDEMTIDPESDFGRALSFFEKRGYRVGPGFMRQRMVWVFDDASRRELLIIYAEDLTDHGLTATELSESQNRWQAAAQGLNQRALGALRLTDL